MDIISKIKALRAKASDAASTEAEVASAIDAADRLMQKNGLTLDDLDKVRQTRKGISMESWENGRKSLHPVQYVAGAIANLSETQGWTSKGADKPARIFFIGFDRDVQYALYLTDLVHNAMESEWKSFTKGELYQSIPQNKRSKAKSDFMRAMASRIRHKMIEMVFERRTKEQPKGTTGTDIVLVKREMVSEAMEEIRRDQNIGKAAAPRKRRVDAAVHHAGILAGERTNVTTGIEA